MNPVEDIPSVAVATVQALVRRRSGSLKEAEPGRTTPRWAVYELHDKRGGWLRVDATASPGFVRVRIYPKVAGRRCPCSGAKVA